MDMSAGVLKNLGFFAVVLAAVLGIRFWMGRTAPVPQAFATEVRLADAIEQSKETGRPVFALFTADWCPGCQQYKRGSLANSEINSELSSRTIPVYVNVDEDKDDVALLASMGLPVGSIPASVVLRGDQIATYAVGARSQAEILSMIEAGEKDATTD